MEVARGAASGLHFGPADAFSVRAASSTEDRVRAWALAYRVYLEKEYAQPNQQKLWYSLHDALPGTVTVLVERGGELIGAVTVVPDSPLGLPADDAFPAETRALRTRGARLAEAVSLVQTGESERTGMLVVAKLCEFTCLVAERLLGATDLVITVNPRHENYYRKVMLFERQGDEASYDKVSGAPAVFLTLNFMAMHTYIATSGMPDAPRTIYRRFMQEHEAAAAAHHLEREHRQVDAEALQRYFSAERPLLESATQEQKEFICGEHAAYKVN